MANCHDEQSPVTSPECGPVTVTSDTTGVTFECVARSLGGSTTVTTETIKRDATDPTLEWGSGAPADGGSYQVGDLPDTLECTGSDATSGGTESGCVITGYRTDPGSHTVTASVSDKAGNTTTQSRTYRVVAVAAPWTVTGFSHPVDMGGVVNVVKGGLRVPLKFEVFDGARELTDVSEVASFTQQTVPCTGGSSLDEVEITTTGGTSLRYDTSSGQFIQNWKTPTKAGVCYQVTMTTTDGPALVAKFQTR